MQAKHPEACRHGHSPRSCPSCHLLLSLRLARGAPAELGGGGCGGGELVPASSSSVSQSSFRDICKAQRRTKGQCEGGRVRGEAVR